MLGDCLDYLQMDRWSINTLPKLMRSLTPQVFKALPFLCACCALSKRHLFLKAFVMVLRWDTILKLLSSVSWIPSKIKSFSIL